MARRYYGTRIIKHPQGTYKVAFLSPARKLSYSKLIWFKNREGRFVKVK